MTEKDFRIVKILDEYNIIINGGFEDNLKVNDEIQILDEDGGTVIDPKTKVLLGSLQLIKATLIISELHPKMSICSSKTTYPKMTELRTTINTLGGALSQASGAPEREKLNVDYSQITGGKKKSDAKIQIGDKVRLISKENK